MNKNEKNNGVDYGSPEMIAIMLGETVKNNLKAAAEVTKLVWDLPGAILEDLFNN